MWDTCLGPSSSNMGLLPRAKHPMGQGQGQNLPNEGNNHIRARKFAVRPV